MDEEDGGGWMRLDTKCELLITVPYQTWKTLEDCAYNRTVRRCSVSYGTDDTEQELGTMVEEATTVHATESSATDMVDDEATSEEPEIEFIEVIYE